MKKLFTVILILLLFAGVFTVSAEPYEIPPAFLEEVIDEIGSDFELLLDGLGSDIDNVLLQNAVSGQNTGMAELGTGKFSSFYIGLPAINLTVTNGFLTFRNNDDYFKQIDLNAILNDIALAGIYDAVGTDKRQLVDLMLDKAAPIPALKLNFGFRLPANLEFIFSGMAIPSSVINMITSFNPDLPAGLNFSYVNAGGVLRYVLFRDRPETPAVSIGLGGYYNKLSLGMSLSEILANQFDTGDATFFDEAEISIGSNLLAFGLDVAVSKRLISIFIPYAKIGAWYSVTSTGGYAVLTEGVEIESDTGHSDLDLLLNAGFDLALGPFIMNFGGNYNAGSGVWGIDLGSRLQF